MGLWILRFLIVFSVIQLEYVTSDPENVKGQSKTNYIDTGNNVNLKRTMRGAAQKDLDAQLAHRALTDMRNTGVVGNPCLAVPCANGAICTWRKDKDPQFTCTCTLGYKGKLCNEVIPECDSQPCKEKGSCVATPKGFVCMCKDGYGGIFCEDTKQNTNMTVFAITKQELEEGKTLLMVFLGLVVFLVLILIIHCVRVNKRRNMMITEYHILLVESEQPPPFPPGLCEVSNLLCVEFLTAACPSWSGRLRAYGRPITNAELDKAYAETMAEMKEVLDEEVPLLSDSLTAIEDIASEDGQNLLSQTDRVGQQKSIRGQLRDRSLHEQLSFPRPPRFASLPTNMDTLSKKSDIQMARGQSARVLPRVGSKSKPSIHMSAEKKWSYQVDPHIIASRRKSLKYNDTQSNSSDFDDTQGRQRSIHSKHSIIKRNERIPESSKHSLNRMSMADVNLQRKRSSRKSITGEIPNDYRTIPMAPPVPPAPPAPPLLKKKSLTRRISRHSAYTQFPDSYIIPPPPLPPVPHLRSYPPYPPGSPFQGDW